MNNRITAYFKNGALYKIRPLNFKKVYEDKTRAYEARYIVSDKVKYDLCDIDSIKSIAIPEYKEGAPIGVTGYLENVLLKHLPTGNDLLDLEILLKYTKLLKYSCWAYSDKDYYRLPKRLYELGAFDQGDEALEKINKYKPDTTNPLKRKNLKQFREDKKRLYPGDLIEIQASYTRCEKCAIYANRIYSVNGEDKRFPKCPDWLIEKGAVCDNGCGSAIFPITYYPDITTLYEYKENYGVIDRVEREPISFSNRPFVDNRNSSEIERYFKLKAERKDKAIKDKYYMLNYRNFCYEKINNPKKALKTFSGYMRRLSRQGKYY